MKALEILININVLGDVTEVQEQIDEAIAELEALKNRSCNNCKYSYRHLTKTNCMCCRYPDFEYCSGWHSK